MCFKFNNNKSFVTVVFQYLNEETGEYVEVVPETQECDRPGSTAEVPQSRGHVVLAEFSQDDENTSDSISPPGTSQKGKGKKGNAKFDLNVALFEEMKRANHEVEKHLEQTVALMSESNDIQKESLQEDKSTNAELISIFRLAFVPN